MTIYLQQICNYLFTLRTGWNVITVMSHKVSWHPKALATKHFDQQLDKANKKENIKGLHYWSFAREIHQNQFSIEFELQEKNHSWNETHAVLTDLGIFWNFKLQG